MSGFQCREQTDSGRCRKLDLHPGKHDFPPVPAAGNTPAARVWVGGKPYDVPIPAAGNTPADLGGYVRDSPAERTLKIEALDLVHSDPRSRANSYEYRRAFLHGIDALLRSGLIVAAAEHGPSKCVSRGLVAIELALSGGCTDECDEEHTGHPPCRYGAHGPGECVPAVPAAPPVLPADRGSSLSVDACNLEHVSTALLAAVVKLSDAVAISGSSRLVQDRMAAVRRLLAEGTSNG